MGGDPSTAFKTSRTHYFFCNLIDSGKALSAHQREHTRVFARLGGREARQAGWQAGWQGGGKEGRREGTTAVVWTARYCTEWTWEERMRGQEGGGGEGPGGEGEGGGGGGGIRRDVSVE